MRIASILIAPLVLAACATVPGSVGKHGLSWAGIGESVDVGGPKVTPMALLEDSRCPADVQCVWAGRVRIRARVDLESGYAVRAITMAEPVKIAGGTLELAETEPARASQDKIPAADYRFGFRFSSGS